MNSKWSWVFGILTAVALVLGIVFFLATQQITARDLVVLTVGGVLGAVIASLIATFIFDGERARDARETSDQTADSPVATKHPPSSARASISVPGRITHRKRRTSLNIRTRVHDVYWATTGSPAGELRPGRRDRFDVIDADGHHLGEVLAVKEGMELIEKSAQQPR